MVAPKSPQAALRVQQVLIATLWIAIVLTVILAVVVLFYVAGLNWSLKAGMLGMISMAALFFAAMMSPARAAADNFRLHSVEDGTHQCQCRDCGRTFTPTPGSPTGPAHAMASPQQRGAAARSMMRISPIVALVLLLALIAAVVIDVTGSGTGAFPLVYTAALLGASAVGLMIIALVARAQRNAMDREIASYSPQHGCTCTWCGRKNTTLSTGRETYRG